jgi:hypothetical protein
MTGLVEELVDEMKPGDFKPVSHDIPLVRHFMRNRGCRRGHANASKF